jgi:hypothetical protein
MNFLNGLAFLGALIGALVATFGVLEANGAPQEAAAAAIGMAWAVIPYCMARLAMEGERYRAEQKAKPKAAEENIFAHEVTP